MRGALTLAIDPTYKGYAFVVLEGRNRLVDWGQADLRSRSIREFRVRVAALIDRFRPDLIVVEDIEASRRGGRARRRVEKLEEMALDLEIDLVHVSRSDVHWAFQLSGTTKYKVAVSLARRFPELIPHLPRERKPWMSEDERMNIFDALSFAIVALGKLGDS